MRTPLFRSPPRRSRGRLLALLSLAFPALTLLASCGGDSGGSATTTTVGSDLLQSRSSTDGTPPSADRPRSSRAPADVPTPSIPEEEIDLEKLGHNAGDATAPIKVVEFSDFGCGYCREFHTEIWPTIEREYVETGKVEWKYIPMVIGLFGPNAEVAAETGECAMEQDRFPAVRDRLFADQSEWKRHPEPMTVFRRIVEDEGLDVSRWEDCMEGDGRERRIVAGTALAQRSGVRGTPAFFIMGVGTIPGVLPLDIFQEVLDSVYAQATRGAPEGGR